MSRNSELKAVYANIQLFKECVKELGLPKGGADRIADFMKEQRRKIRRINDQKVDPLAKSMQDDWRHSWDEYGEGGYDYGIVADDGKTEEEIREWVYEAIGYPEINSPYDCTGKRFTSWISVHKCGLGFAVVHRWCLDI